MTHPGARRRGARANGTGRWPGGPGGGPPAPPRFAKMPGCRSLLSNLLRAAKAAVPGETIVIDDRFIFIHVPKTGGSFVKAVTRIALFKEKLGRFHWLVSFRAVSSLKAVRKKYMAFVPPATLDPVYLPFFQLNRQAVAKDRLFTVIRHPLDHLVSKYEFDRSQPGWRDDWSDASFPDFVRRQYDGIPDRLWNDFGIRRTEMKMNVGLYSFIYVKYLFRNPGRALRLMDSSYFTGGRWRADMANLHFVKYESLNDDLHRVLLKFGMDRKHVDFIRRTKRRVNVSRLREGRPWSEYYDDALLEYVLEREWPLFRMFPWLSRLP